jgi:hypothetical protein
MTIQSRAEDCAEFYRLRDLRTESYLDQPWHPTSVVRVVVGARSARTEVGQHLVLALTNMLARVHRQILFTLPDQPAPLLTFSVANATDFADAVIETARAIDPCGSFERAAEGGDIVLGIGPDVESGLDWYLGADRALAYLAERPVVLNTEARGTLRGAGLAACLGAVAAFKEELGWTVVPRIVSAWNYDEGADAESGSADLDELDVGHVLVVGAGAVGSALAYWLRSWGVGGRWTVVDKDTVELHNTNRGMVFLPAHAGWPSGERRRKAELVAELLPAATAVPKWYHAAKEIHDQRFDLILALANAYGVRSVLARRNATVLLHATTGKNWLSQLHRHVAGHDDCIACRLGDVKEVAFDCSVAEIETAHEEPVDAALPFLSAASGLMLATLLQRLQAGVLLDTTANNWRWDFLSSHRMVAPAGRSKCLAGCTNWYPASVRRAGNAGTAWAHLDGGN